MNVRLSALLMTLCCSALAGGPLLADTTEAKAAQADSAAPELSLWIKDAPMSLIVRQLAQSSGREAAIEGTLDTPVSGRFTGSLEQTLAELAAGYPVLFDLDESALHAVDSESGSSVSIAVVSDELSEDFKTALFEQLVPGNDIEIRADAVRVSGHPDFVKRATGFITGALADNGARQIVELKSKVGIEGAVEGLAGAADNVDQAAGVAVIDAGSDEMLADMADEGKPAADQATLSKPIRWVTDIPGYDTF